MKVPAVVVDVRYPNEDGQLAELYLEGPPMETQYGITESDKFGPTVFKLRHKYVAERPLDQAWLKVLQDMEERLVHIISSLSNEVFSQGKLTPDEVRARFWSLAEVEKGKVVALVYKLQSYTGPDGKVICRANCFDLNRQPLPTHRITAGSFCSVMLKISKVSLVTGRLYPDTRVVQVMRVRMGALGPECAFTETYEPSQFQVNKTKTQALLAADAATTPPPDDKQPDEKKPRLA